MRNKGFTLIEIMIVTITIGLLAGIVIPTYLTSIDKAARNKAETTLKNIWTAEKIYYMNNAKYSNQFKELEMSDPNLKDPYFTYNVKAAPPVTFKGRFDATAVKNDYSYTLSTTCNNKSCDGSVTYK